MGAEPLRFPPLPSHKPEYGYRREQQRERRVSVRNGRGRRTTFGMAASVATMKGTIRLHPPADKKCSIITLESKHTGVVPRQNGRLLPSKSLGGGANAASIPLPHVPRGAKSHLLGCDAGPDNCLVCALMR